MANLLRALLALSLLGWLGVDAVAGGLELVCRLTGNAGVWHKALATPLDARRRRTLDERDLEAGRPRGYVNGIVDAFLEHVPPHETVYATGFETRKAAQVLVPVPHLCFPRRIDWAPASLQPDWKPFERCYLLTFDPNMNARLSRLKCALATGPDWTLWH